MQRQNQPSCLGWNTHFGEQFPICLVYSSFIPIYLFFWFKRLDFHYSSWSLLRFPSEDVFSVAGIAQQADGNPWPSRTLFCQVHSIQRWKGKSHPVKAVLLQITLEIFCKFLQGVKKKRKPQIELDLEDICIRAMGSMDIITWVLLLINCTGSSCHCRNTYMKKTWV